MDIKVTTAKVTIKKEIVNKGEYNIRECNFDLAEEYNGLVCKALFTVEKTNKTYEQSIVNNKCTIPYEVTVQKGAITLGVIGYEIQDDELIKRYSPLPYHFTIDDGSYIEDIENQAVPTPSDLEQLEQRVSAIEIDAEQVEINKQDISDIKQEQITQNNDILLRSLITETGSQIELSLNSSNFKMTAILKDKNGTVVNTSNEIDLPLESVVVNASYDNTTKEIILTLQNGNTVRFSVADLVSGLQTEITSSNKLSSDLVDDTNNTNKFVTPSEKTQIQTNAQDIADIKTEQTTQNNEITALQAENTKLKQQQAQDRATYPTTTGEGENVTLDKTAEMEFIQPPLPRGNSEQVQYSGKNLANTPSITTIQSNIRNIDIPCQAEPGSYILSLEEWQTTGTEEVSAIELRNDNTAVAYLQIGRTQLIKNITINSTITKIRIYSQSSYNTSVNAETTITNLMFKKASITDNTYEPYVGGTASPNPSYPQEITNVTGDVEVLVQNKNLINLNRSEQGGIDASGVDIIGSTLWRSNTYIKVEPNTTYVFSRATSLSTFILRLYEYDRDKNFITPRIEGENTTLFITTSANTQYLKWSIYYNAALTLDMVNTFNLQLEQGTTATTYTPHKEQTYTFPLGNQRMYLGDYLADDGIHHVRKHIDMGSLIWSYSGGRLYSNSTMDIVKGNIGGEIASNILADIYTAIKPSEWYDKTKKGIAIGGNGYGNAGTILVYDEDYTSATDFTNAVDGHYIECELLEEEITPYTTEQQQAYDEIKQAISYEEQTNISGSSDESNPILSVEAFQSLKLVLAS